MCTTQAYIMHIIRSVLMPDANNNRVHLMYLPLLTDLQNVHSYSWSSAVLAMLYRELCRTTKPSTVDIDGCLILLQSWALYWMSLLASIAQRPQIDIAFDLQPSLEYIQLYSSTGKPYLFVGQSILVPPHMHQLGAYDPKPEPEPEPKPAPAKA
ncbi:hypothetical protein PVK06_004921 [Gossypium arboreum]|uniref:Aminotransferase-like plant mobile domain-containing protein n=1 Tax=Gossypium arboreum TaxID=29729 RepID=A0ABR0QTQ2_GOSAR|nr:hypothetical protein PVK06_004921 [Gossypium arboreum]